MWALATGSETFFSVSGEVVMEFHALVEQQRIDPLTMHAWRLHHSCTRLGLPPPPPQAADLYRRTLIEATAPAPGADTLLGCLAVAGIRVAIITNAYDAEEQRTRIRAAFPATGFEQVVVAGEHGHPKPHRDPFDELLGLLDVAAREVAYVGDLPRHDIPGAVAVGMRPIIVSPRPRTRELATAMGASSFATLDALSAQMLHHT